MKKPSQINETPSQLGFSMPAEWETHEATWLGWPHNETDWPGKLDTIRWVYGEMVRKIGAGEFVRILVNNKAQQNLARSYLKRAGADLRKLRFITHPTNRGWTRDTGPIFVKKSSTSFVPGTTGVRKSKVQSPKSETAIVHFHFNAWAKYSDWQKDRKVPKIAARILK